MTTAITTTFFIGTLGVNTHIGDSGAYSDISELAQDIKYLGVPTVRDSVTDASVIPEWQQVAQAAGIKFDDYMPEGAPAWDQTALSLVPQLVADGLLAFVEGGNEEDDSYAIANGNSLAWTAQFQQQVWAMGQQYHLPVINMSFGSGWTAANNWEGDYPNVGDLSAYTTYANAHTYPNVGQTPDSTIQSLNSDAQLAASERQVITTEMGWQTSQYSLTQIAQFVVDATFDGIKDGDAGTWFYGLYDDSSGTWGLFNSDGSARPAATALHDLTTLLADTGSNFTPGSLNYTLSGTQSGDNSFLMEKSDGSFWIGLWDESGTTHTVTVKLPSTAKTITVFDPITGTSAIQSASSASSISVSLGGDPLLIEIAGSGSSSSSGSTGSTGSTGSSTGTSTSASPDDLALAVPSSETLSAGATKAITGVSVSDPWATTVGGSMALNVWDKSGKLTIDGQTFEPGGGPVANGMFSGTLAQINADLATLSYTAAGSSGSDTITVDVWNQAGVEVEKTIPVTVSGSTSTGTTSGSTGTSATSNDLAVTVPASESLAAATSKAVSGLSVSDPWAATATGAMALNVWDSAGTLTIDGEKFGPGGGPVANGMFSGTLAQINADLATLSYTAGASAGTDTITVDVWNQAGVEVTKTIPVTVTASSSGGTGTTTNSSTVTIAADDSDPVITQNNVSVVATSGDHTLYIEGTGDTVSSTGGNETVMAFLGGNTITTTGVGGNTIRIAGTGNVVAAGSGSNEIDDSGSSNRIVLPVAGQGNDAVYGYILENSDTLDLRPLLKGTSWTGTAATLGNFVHVGVPDGSDAVISVTPTGVAGSTSYNVATLESVGPISLSTFLAHSIT